MYYEENFGRETEEAGGRRKERAGGKDRQAGDTAECGGTAQPRGQSSTKLEMTNAIPVARTTFVRPGYAGEDVGPILPHQVRY
jgi:hypothetical protein